MAEWGHEDRREQREPAEEATDADRTAPLERSTWVSWLFPSSEFRTVLRRSVLLSAAVFVLGLLLSLAVGESASYLFQDTPAPGETFVGVNFLGLSAVMGTVGVFIELFIIGQWSIAYARIWDGAEACFAPGERARYRSLVDDYLDRMYRIRLDRVYDVKLALVAFVLFEPVFIVEGNGLDLTEGFDLVLAYLNVVLIFLGFLALFLFLAHVRLVAALGGLELDNIYTAARGFEPVAGLGASVSVSWFVGVTVLALYYWLNSGTTLVDPLIYRGVPLSFGLALHLFLMSVLIVVGALIFAVPLWLIHLQITAGKRDLVDAIDGRRNELLRGWSVGSTPDPDVVGELDLLEGVQRTTDRIRTWPYFVSDLVAVAVSAVVPLAQVVLLVV